MAFPSKPPEANNGWVQRMIQPIWNWLYARQALPDPNDFTLSERPNGIAFGLKPSGVITAVADAILFPLKLTDASDEEGAIINVRLGNAGNDLADSSMTDEDGMDVTLSATGVRYIYCRCSLSYDAASNSWPISARAVLEGASVPTGTSSFLYFEIGHAERESNGDSGFRVKSGTIHQEAFGSQTVIRIGDDTIDFFDFNWGSGASFSAPPA